MRSEARYYDLLAWLLTLGRERAFRERLVDLARLAPGEAVLDVGCGTGTLAIATKGRVGPTGIAVGIDASPEMIERATRKAAAEGAEVQFRTAIVEALPFPDASFDVVLSTLMLHHLPRAVREQSVREMRRVLKPGGRLLAVDFATPARARRGLLGRLHRHGHFALENIVTLLTEGGLAVREKGTVGVSDLHFALAMVADAAADSEDAVGPPVERALPPLPTPRWTYVAVVVALLAGHLLALRIGLARFALPTLVAAGVVGVLGIAHSRVGSAVHALRRRHTRH